MSFVYLPGQGEDSLLQNGCLDLERSAMSKKKPIQSRSFEPGSGMDSLTTPRSGQMSEALPNATTNVGHSSGSCGRYAATWLSRQVSPVSPSASPGKEKPEPMKETAGLTPFVSLEKSGPGGFFWKTFQICFPGLTGILDKFSETWPRAGMMQDGIVYRLRPLAPLTRETGFGLPDTMWPTPQARMGDSSNVLIPHQNHYIRPSGQKAHLRLTEAVKLWSTPVVSGNHNRKGASETSGDGPATTVKKWPTPRSGDGATGALRTPESIMKSGGDKSRLEDAVVLSSWPTPSAADGTGGPGNSGRQGGLNLRTAVAWATPTASPWRSDKASEQTHNRNSRPLSEQVVKQESKKWRTPNASVIEPKSSVKKLTGRTPQDPQVGLADQAGGSLNPNWVELLMGWPMGWTSLDPLPAEEFEAWLEGMLGNPESHYGKEAWASGRWESGIPRTAKGVKNRVGRLKAIGNGQVPAVVGLAWEVLIT